MEIITLTMSSVGQITIPRNIRDLLDLKKGARVNILVDQTTKSITIKKQPTFEEIMAEIDQINAEYPDHIDPIAKNMTASEMVLEGIKNLEEDKWP